MSFQEPKTLVQNFYKALAVMLPPIPPLIVGLIVFWKRRKRELEGVIDERRRSIAEMSNPGVDR